VANKNSDLAKALNQEAEYFNNLLEVILGLLVERLARLT
jgi:hypothetical protein